MLLAQLSLGALRAVLVVVGATVITMMMVTAFGVDRRRRGLDLMLSRAASLAVSLGGGWRIASAGAARTQNKPRANTIELYDYEGCPFCRKVRVAMDALGLDCVVRPCPRPTFDAGADAAVARGHSRFRPDVLEMGGRLQMPFLVDRNVGVQLYESGDIVEHLRMHYGGGKEGDDQCKRGFGTLSTLASFVASGLRSAPRMGLLRAAVGKAPPPPKELLELLSRENDASCRLVREALCVLELPYVLRNDGGCGGGGISETLPLLRDPNTGFRSAGDAPGAVDYLYVQYLPPGAAASSTFSASWVWWQRFQALGRGLLGSRGNGSKLE